MSDACVIDKSEILVQCFGLKEFNLYENEQSKAAPAFEEET